MCISYEKKNFSIIFPQFCSLLSMYLGPRFSRLRLRALCDLSNIVSHEPAAFFFRREEYTFRQQLPLKSSCFSIELHSITYQNNFIVIITLRMSYLINFYIKISVLSGVTFCILLEVYRPSWSSSPFPVHQYRLHRTEIHIHEPHH